MLDRFMDEKNRPICLLYMVRLTSFTSHLEYDMDEDLKNIDLSKLSARNRILKTAITLFNEVGVHSTGIDRIIAESGVAKMTFYNHFPSKNDLIVAYLDYRDTTQFDRLKKHTIEKTKNPRLQILGIFDALEEWFLEADYRGCAFTKGLADFGNAPESAAFQSVQNHFSKWLAFVAAPLRELTTSKLLPAAQTQLMSLIIGSIMLASAGAGAQVARTNKKAAKLLLDVL